MKRTIGRTHVAAEADAANDSAPHKSSVLVASEEAESHDVGLTSDERRRRRAAELRSEAAALDGGDLSEEDFHTLNGGGPAARLHDAVWTLPSMTERQIDAARRQQWISYKGLAPADEMERARARQLVLLETAATGAFQKAAANNADIATSQAYLELALRCLEGFNKISDRFERARGQAQQQIFVQHNRFDNGSRAVLQNVQTERVESNSGALPLLNGEQGTNGENTAVMVEPQPPQPPKQGKRGGRLAR